ncbi:MAG TPA: hypothetical protein EYP53_06260 [Candidatus Latescibacteria bacterium]|nr:hypothetical protein [Candidatus Latescibacterota bacterium]
MYIEVDIEGICGVITEDQIFLERKSKAYAEACLLMTEGVNAAVEDRYDCLSIQSLRLLGPSEGNSARDHLDRVWAAGSSGRGLDVWPLWHRQDHLSFRPPQRGSLCPGGIGP